jgi:hypothetical protein
MSEWDFRWQESRNPPRRPVRGRWRRSRPQGLADCFPGNISAGSAGGDPGADPLWQGELRRDSAAFGQQADDVAAARATADLSDFGVGEPVVAPRVRRRRREPDDTFPLPPWPRPSPAATPAPPVRSDDGRDERS